MSHEDKHNLLLFRLRAFLCFQAGHNTAEIARRMGVDQAFVANTIQRREGSIENAIAFTRTRIAHNRRKWAQEPEVIAVQKNDPVSRYIAETKRQKAQHGGTA